LRSIREFRGFPSRFLCLRRRLPFLWMLRAAEKLTLAAGCTRLDRYSVENVPCMVAVSLKRFDEQLLKIESQVDFPSQLNLHKYDARSCACAKKSVTIPGVARRQGAWPRLAEGGACARERHGQRA